MEFGDCPCPTLDAAAEELRAQVGAAVHRRMVSDVPLGVLLSGGIDSSAVTAFAARETTRLRTFSIGFDERSFDESRFARRVAERFGTEHTEACFSTAELLALIPEVFAYL